MCSRGISYKQLQLTICVLYSDRIPICFEINYHTRFLKNIYLKILLFYRSEEEISIDAHLEGILASECTMIVLDTIETIIQVCFFINLIENKKKNILNKIGCSNNRLSSNTFTWFT